MVKGIHHVSLKTSSDEEFARAKDFYLNVLGLSVCRECGEEKVLLTCDQTNEASRRTIMKNGGKLENEVSDDFGIEKSGIIQRYWITL